MTDLENIIIINRGLFPGKFPDQFLFSNLEEFQKYLVLYIIIIQYQFVDFLYIIAYFFYQNVLHAYDKKSSVYDILV